MPLHWEILRPASCVPAFLEPFPRATVGHTRPSCHVRGHAKCCAHPILEAGFDLDTQKALAAMFLDKIVPNKLMPRPALCLCPARPLKSGRPLRRGLSVRDLARGAMSRHSARPHSLGSRGAGCKAQRRSDAQIQGCQHLTAWLQLRCWEQYPWCRWWGARLILRPSFALRELQNSTGRDHDSPWCSVLDACNAHGIV